MAQYVWIAEMVRNYGEHSALPFGSEEMAIQWLLAEVRQVTDEYKGNGYIASEITTLEEAEAEMERLNNWLWAEGVSTEGETYSASVFKALVNTRNRWCTRLDKLKRKGFWK